MNPIKRRVTLSGNKMTSRETMHTYLSKKLKFPAYYGKNLDALHDCLASVATPLHITVTYTDQLLSATGSYGEAFLKVLRETAEENKSLTVTLFKEKRE